MRKKTVYSYPHWINYKRLPATDPQPGLNSLLSMTPETFAFFTLKELMRFDTFQHFICMLTQWIPVHLVSIPILHRGPEWELRSWPLSLWPCLLCVFLWTRVRLLLCLPIYNSTCPNKCLFVQICREFFLGQQCGTCFGPWDVLMVSCLQCWDFHSLGPSWGLSMWELTLFHSGMFSFTVFLDHFLSFTSLNSYYTDIGHPGLTLWFYDLFPFIISLTLWKIPSTSSSNHPFEFLNLCSHVFNF